MVDIIELSPHWLKSLYVTFLKGIKYLLQKMRLLDYFDSRAKTNRKYHYLRSLLALHQLDDMIALDVPWWTYDAINAVEDYFKNADHPIEVFEYGSGASTVWLAKRCDQVISLEHDQHWFAKLKAQLTTYPNVQLYFTPTDLYSPEKQYISHKMKNVSFRSYVTQIRSFHKQYDLIIIDGRARQACLKEALNYLKPNGIILFDNSDRSRYQSALEKSGCKIQRFKGLVAGSPLPSESAILRR